MKIAIFASGSGTNAEAIIQATEQGRLDATVSLIVTDRPSAKVVERAEKHCIDVFAFNPKEYETKAEFEKEIVEILQENKISFVVLAGYMRLIGSTLLEAYEGRMINIHPSLLPSFPGLDAIGQALAANVQVTGVTIHLVDSGMDTGPIIAQEPVRIEKNDTIETLRQKVQALEHRVYPETLQALFIEQRERLDRDE
ncbi:phosphoribosylglycinamide formyltransferase [Bacillus suaedae]|uniref:Phosphoribosylglycinamide formyltransferase n=1 Tax=Halalkalibacter suaedae TaxID=2822140 RepID=A0A940WXU2_9BACI|nr:phosphoribosylglycinamide formyltransferase [Bacillus suaedae]MBP3952578.1 phosphoribosylglycinamide formyltransferase [Bacillus suaedae]